MSIHQMLFAKFTSGPAAPTGLTVTQYSVATIDISWTTTSLRYRIYSNSTLIYDSSSAVSANSYSLTGLSSNTSYTIDVALVDSGGTEGAKATVVQSTRTRIANATGGTIYYNGIYQYHVFTSTSTFTLTQRNSTSSFGATFVCGGSSGSSGGGFYSYGGDGGSSGKYLIDTTSFDTSSFTLNTGYTVTVGGASSNSYMTNYWSSSYINSYATAGASGGAGGSYGGGGNGSPGSVGYGGTSVWIVGSISVSGGGGGGGASSPGGYSNNDGGSGGSGSGVGGDGGDGGGAGYYNGCGPFGNDGNGGGNASANTGGGGGGGGSGAEGSIDDGCCYPCGNPGRDTVGGSGGGGGSGVVIFRIAVA